MKVSDYYSELIDEEEEQLGEEECSDTPFDPRIVNIYAKSLVVSLLIRRIKMGALDLHPDFQRSSGVWTKVKQSRLIESLLIKIPIPSLYLDSSNDNKWLVIDGLQRLSTIDDFVNDRFALTHLEFLRELEGLRYSDLSSNYQMRIDETEITSYLVMPGTPLRIKFDIFRRINTGGVPLSQQEIRHALNIGPCTQLLAKLSSSPEFQAVIAGGISNMRMGDRECILRYLAFLERTPESYQRRDFNMFLCEYMAAFNAQYKGQSMESPEIQMIAKRFLNVMTLLSKLFGEKACRLLKSTGEMASKRINKALFEAWAVSLAKVDDISREILLERKETLISRFAEALSTNDDFAKSVCQSTGSVAAVQTRFSTIESIIGDVVYA